MRLFAFKKCKLLYYALPETIIIIYYQGAYIAITFLKKINCVNAFSSRKKAAGKTQTYGLSYHELYCTHVVGSQQ